MQLTSTPLTTLHDRTELSGWRNRDVQGTLRRGLDVSSPAFGTDTLHLQADERGLHASMDGRDLPVEHLPKRSIFPASDKISLPNGGKVFIDEGQQALLFIHTVKDGAPHVNFCFDGNGQPREVELSQERDRLSLTNSGLRAETWNGLGISTDFNVRDGVQAKSWSHTNGGNWSPRTLRPEDTSALLTACQGLSDGAQVAYLAP